MSGSLIGVTFFQPFAHREFCYRMVPLGLQKSYDVACSKYGWDIPFPQLTVHSSLDEKLVDLPATSQMKRD